MQKNGANGTRVVIISKLSMFLLPKMVQEWYIAYVVYVVLMGSILGRGKGGSYCCIVAVLIYGIWFVKCNKRLDILLFIVEFI